MGPILTAILGGSGPIGKAVEVAVERLIPDKHLAERLNAEIQAEFARTDMQGTLAQIELNKVEAANPNVWTSGWRPFIGWVGGVGFAVQFVVIPLLGYVYAMFGYKPPPPLVLDPILWQVIFGILGIGFGTRTFEKLKGVAS